MQRIPHRIGTLLVLWLALANSARAGDVLQQVPRDALGFAVIHNLSQADAKAGKVLGAFGSRLPGPLALLKSIAGLDAGLDHGRDLLVVLLPPENNSRQFHLAVWLPVKDYDVLVRSLDGDPQRRVAAVTLAGEDLLVVRQGDWAIVMDPEQRDRLEQTRGDTVSPPPQLAQWAEWIDTNDAAVVVLPAGMRTLWALAASEKLFDPAPEAGPQKATDNDLFAPPAPTARATDGWPAVRNWIRATLADAPELARWAAEAEGAACGLRLDDEGDALVGLRLAFSQDMVQPVSAEGAAADVHAAPRLYDAGDFVVTGWGQVSSRWVVPAVAPYVRQAAQELATEYGNKLDDADVTKFRQMVEQAVADVQAFSVLTRPGAGQEAVYTNNFLALRVASSQAFLERAAEIMQLWNKMLDKAQGAIRLVFKSKPITIGKHKSTEYSIDMGAAVGGPAIPEFKASMEKLFGPGGEFRLQFVAIDDHTVLLAAATEAQVEQVIAVMGRQIKPATDQAELLAEESDWQLFASPHGYSEWLRRQMDAILGAVIGGPVVPQFPVAPPVGFAGGVAGRIVWTEVAVPADTIRGFGKYMRK